MRRKRKAIESEQIHPVAIFERDVELAWQAGIIDGEGTITISKQIRKERASPSFRPFIVVTNTNINIVSPFSTMWGGPIYRNVDARTEKKWSDSFDWYCPQGKVVEFLTSIIPYLRGKSKQAELVIEFMNSAKSFPRRKGSFIGKHRGGSAPLGEEEILHRDRLKKDIQMLNAKSKIYRSSMNGGDALCNQQID